jgi:FKBP-type peptidyl-prolyl cis-trans isomerase SlyD
MSTSHVTKNKAVFFTYAILDENGEVLEQSDLPMSYVHGSDSGLIEKVEQALDGCAENESVEVKVTSEEGYGDYNSDLTYTDELDNVPTEYHKIGAEVQFQNDEGEVKTFMVSKIEDGKLTVDGNHPFAGKDLIFKITVTEIRDATQEEIDSGKPSGKPYSIH